MSIAEVFLMASGAGCSYLAICDCDPYCACRNIPCMRSKSDTTLEREPIRVILQLILLTIAVGIDVTGLIFDWIMYSEDLKSTVSVTNSTNTTVELFDEDLDTYVGHIYRILIVISILFCLALLNAILTLFPWKKSAALWVVLVGHFIELLELSLTGGLSIAMGQYYGRLGDIPSIAEDTGTTDNLIQVIVTMVLTFYTGMLRGVFLVNNALNNGPEFYGHCLIRLLSIVAGALILVSSTVFLSMCLSLFVRIFAPWWVMMISFLIIIFACGPCVCCYPYCCVPKQNHLCDNSVEPRVNHSTVWVD